MKNIDDIKYNEDGLVPVITQDESTMKVLMLAYAKKEQIIKTIKTRKAHYFSRSRNQEWIKGESSGNTQEIVEVLTDCDLDTVLYMVNQQGNACHTGNYTCFYRKINEKGEIADE